MTRDDIIRSSPPINAEDFGVPAEFAERAENYVRWAVAAEREACAKVCEDEYRGYDWADRERDGAESCAAAIRARGQA